MDQSLEQIEHWHELLDALCSRDSFADSAALAAEYCAMTNGGGRNQLETAIRNLNNWRSGRHLPRLRSVKVLERLLNVADDPALLEKWNQLYQRARLDEPEETEAAEATAGKPGTAPSHGAGRLIRAAAVGAILFGLGVATGTVAVSGWRPWGGPADDAPFVVYHPQVRLVVGQSMVVHGERGDCGKLPRDWRDVVGHLPTSTLGEFSDGGLVRRHSMFCKGITPARGIRFTATKPGMEEMYITGDYMKILVVAREDAAAAEPVSGSGGPP